MKIRLKQDTFLNGTYTEEYFLAKAMNEKGEDIDIRFKLYDHWKKVVECFGNMAYRTRGLFSRDHCEVLLPEGWTPADQCSK
jgi:hypothetical protein